MSPRKSVVQSACQYDVTSLVSDFQNGEQSIHRLHHRNARRIFQPQRKSRSLYSGENDEILEDMSEGQTNKYFDLYDSISAQMIR